MSPIDFPDFTRGTVAPGKPLATFTGAELSGTVYPPPNTDVLWIASGQYGGAVPSVEDADTGGEFPVYLVKGSTGFGIPQYFWIALIEYPTANGIAIEWTSRGSVGWSVFAQAGGRMVYDLAVAAALGANGAAIGSNLIMVGGSDGTDAHYLLTDSTGKLQVADSASGAAIGPPGSPPPTDAIQVAGTDGTDLRALKTDSAGVLQVSGSSFPTVYGPPGAAAPADALLVGGSDGTDLRALLADSLGRLLVKDFYLSLAVGGIGAAVPVDAIAAGVSDGTDLRISRANQAGIQYVIPSAPATLASDHPPNELLALSGGPTASGTSVIAAPGAGKRIRVFSATVSANTIGQTGFLYDTVSGDAFIGSSVGTASMPFGPSGFALSANAAVAVSAGGASTLTWSICYTIEVV